MAAGFLIPNFLGDLETKLSCVGAVLLSGGFRCWAGPDSAVAWVWKVLDKGAPALSFLPRLCRMHQDRLHHCPLVVDFQTLAT